MRALSDFDDDTRAWCAEMLADGFRVVTAWGPASMAYAQLDIERDGSVFRWEAGRGYHSPVELLGEGIHDLRFVTATYAWATEPNERGIPRVPNAAVLDRREGESAIIRPHWRDVLAWLPHADHDRLDRISTAWWTRWPFIRWPRPTGDDIAEWVAGVEAAAS